VSIDRKPELAWRESTEGQVVGKATPRVVLWRAEWASPMATAMSIENEAPKREWGFH
jgi:hypothetical protein